MTSIQHTMLCFLSLALCASIARAQDATPPPLAVKGAAVELGAHEPGSSAIQEIKVRNTSDSPITITRAAGNCVCMGLIVRDTTIPAGGTGKIVLAVDTPKIMGRLTREMYVFAAGYRPPLRVPVYADLQYKVVVNKGALPEVIDRAGVLTLTSSDEQMFRVLRVGGEPPVPATEGKDTSVPARSHAVRYDLGDAALADLPRFLTIETDHPGARYIPVKVNTPGLWDAWRRSRHIRPVLERETLFPAAPGKPVTILVEMAGVKPGPPESVGVTSSNPDISARVLAVRQPPQGGGGVACDIELTPKEGLSGPFHTVLNLKHKRYEAGLDVFGIAESRKRRIRYAE